MFQVPVQTLRDRVKGHIDPHNLHLGGDLVFSEEEEEALVEHVETMAELGYGPSNMQLQHLAGELAHAFGKRATSKPLSNSWLYRFLKRWKHRITSLKPRALDSNRAKCATPEAVDMYFENLDDVLKKYDLKDKPQFIYNLDETGIQPEHRPPNVIAPVNSKPQAVTSPRSTTTTVIGCSNAEGNSIPLFFVFKGKKFMPDLMKGASPGARCTMSETGWSNRVVFTEYLETHFLPHVRRGANDDQRIVLILDGHTSHYSTPLIDWANSIHLSLVVLPAHTSHLLQPLDVSIFGPFKAYYYNECASFMRANMGQVVTRYKMCDLACKAYLKAMTPTNIVGGFKKTGIYPFNKEAVAKEKLFPSECFRDSTPIQKVKALKCGKAAIEQYLREKMEKNANTYTDSKPESEIPTTSAKKVKKPSPGGNVITGDAFRTSMADYEMDKENRDPKESTSSKKEKGKKTTAARQTTHTEQTAPATRTTDAPCSPKASTSGVSKSSVLVSEDSDMDSEVADSELCCVCKKFSPPTLKDRPYLKIVNWGRCDRSLGPSVILYQAGCDQKE